MAAPIYCKDCRFAFNHGIGYYTCCRFREVVPKPDFVNGGYTYEVSGLIDAKDRNVDGACRYFMPKQYWWTPIAEWFKAPRFW